MKTCYLAVLTILNTLLMSNAVLGQSAVKLAIRPLVEVSWEAEPGRSYQLQRNTQVASTGWENLGFPIFGTNTIRYLDYLDHASASFYRVVTLSSPVIPDPEGNLIGDTNRAYMDILSTTLQVEGGNYVLTATTAAPFPSSAAMKGDKRFDFVWFIDMDRNLQTGQNESGNDYNVHLFLTQDGWQFAWLKVSSASQQDGVVFRPEDFQIRVQGSEASLVFPTHYLPTRAFELWLTCFSGNAPTWIPNTANPSTSRGIFQF